MSAGRAALPMALGLLVGCLDQPWVVADLRVDADEDGGSDEDDDGSDDDGSAPRKDGGFGRCTSCSGGLPVPGSCAANLPWSLSCTECGCCNDSRDCARDWERDRRYGCEERSLPDKRLYGVCVELDKRPTGGSP